MNNEHTEEQTGAGGIVPTRSEMRLAEQGVRAGWVSYEMGCRVAEIMMGVVENDPSVRNRVSAARVIAALGHIDARREHTSHQQHNGQLRAQTDALRAALAHVWCFGPIFRWSVGKKRLFCWGFCTLPGRNPQKV